MLSTENAFYNISSQSSLRPVEVNVSFLAGFFCQLVPHGDKSRVFSAERLSSLRYQCGCLGAQAESEVSISLKAETRVCIG